MSEIKMHTQESAAMFAVWLIATVPITFVGGRGYGILNSLMGIYLAYARHRQWTALVKDEEREQQ